MFVFALGIGILCEHLVRIRGHWLLFVNHSQLIVGGGIPKSKKRISPFEDRIQRRRKENDKIR